MAAIANKIIIGNDLNNPILTFENATIREVTSDTAVSMIGDELFIDQFTPIVEYEVWVPRIYKPTDAKAFVSSDGKIFCSRQNYDLRQLPYGTKITYYYDDQPGGEFFCKHVERVGKTQYKINGISAIGLMDKQYHKGGLYVATPFADVLREITGPDYEYSIDGIVATQPVFGWLPYGTRRANLHQLLLAYGVNIVKGDNGKMFFTFLESTDPIPIPESRVFSGGSVVYDEPASRLEVTEHGYYYTPEVDDEVIYDNTNSEPVTNTLVTFDKPIEPNSIYAEVPEGEERPELFILERGVNHAYVSGSGILRGKPYMHFTRIISADNENAQVERVIRVEDATLVSAMNSSQTLQRLSEYYFHAITVKEDIQVEDEITGGRYIVKDVYNEQFTGFITRMSTNYSSFRRGTCEFIKNYNPNGIASTYLHSTIVPLDEGDDVTWFFPPEVFENERPTVRVVLIGHGYTGTNGARGQNSIFASDHAASGGEGGIGGTGGNGGRILIVTIDPTNHDRLRVYNSGMDSVLDYSGTVYSSTNGASRRYGYFDPFTNMTYAVHGKLGVQGGKGGEGDYYPHNAAQANTATPGEDVVYEGIKYTGGAIGERSMWTGATLGISPNLHVYVSGRGGGGAAGGTNGHPPVPSEDHKNNAAFFALGGYGADAAQAYLPEDLYGNGGNGGNGGGGGGAAAVYHWWNWVYSALIAETGPDHAGDPSTTPGGKGGSPSIGRHGCAIIYW